MLTFVRSSHYLRARDRVFPLPDSQKFRAGDPLVPKEFVGSYTVAVTPFTKGGLDVDDAALRNFIDWQIECGVPGIIVLGTTGEFLTISLEERRRIVNLTVQHCAGRMNVLVGTMDAYTPRAVDFSREAQDLGADGLMIIPPYYYTPTDDEIFGYYRAICEAVSLPIMLYNNPVTSNRDMSAALVARLTASFDNVRYIKEASMDVARVHDIVDLTGGVMNVFAGERPVESFLLGAVGYVNPYGNYLPYSTRRLWDLLRAGRTNDAMAIQRLVHKADQIIAKGHPTYGHQCYSKALAAAVGHPVGDVRPPLTSFDSLGEEGRDRLARILTIFDEIGSLMQEIDAREHDLVAYAA